MKNIFVLNKNYKQIGTLSNEGANPQAPYYEDLYTQELETGADTYYFSTMSTPYTQDILEIGNHIMFAYKNKYELFTITSLEYSHSEGYKTIGVYAEGVGFELLEVFMKRPENEKESGRDEDNDGDDNYDDEYADVDDLYIDENGNIIYNKYGKEDYADPDNVSIDGNGNIIYRRSKNNRKNDSLEFKNISYPRFLSILLKNSGWTYVCQPGLEEVKHDIRVRYDTNIYAILQDSMQDYKGVELQFSYSMMGGQVHKIIMAYKDGGRGSFVGNRFEYGVNVRGITKTQEVANSEDDTVYFVDNVGIEVTYDVDFALKSTEVPEIEIGDTHYVIDKDFYPPMTIKARIGKIEISFSDRTKNKIYLANNKKVRGSAIEDELDEDTIKDIIDDNTTDPGEVPEGPEDPTTPLIPVAGSNDMIKAPRMHSYEFLLYTNVDDVPNSQVSNRITDCNCVDWAPEINNTFSNKQIHDYLMYETDVFDVSYKALDVLRYNKTGTPSPSNYCFRLVPHRTGKVNRKGAICEGGYYGDTDYTRDCTLWNEVSSRIFSDLMAKEDRPDFDIDGLLPISSNHFDKHMLDIGSLTCGLVSALQYHVKNVHGGSGGDTGGGTGGDPVYGEDATFNTLCANNITVYEQFDTEQLVATTSALVGDLTAGGVTRLRDEVNFPDGTTCTRNGWTWAPGSGNNTSGDPGDTSGNYATKAYVDNQIAVLEPSVNKFLALEPGINSLLLLKPDIERLIADSGDSSGGGNTSGNSGCIFEKVSDNFYYTDNDVQIERDLYVNGTLHINSGDGMGMGIVDCDILKVTEIQFSNGDTLPVNNIATVSELSEYATVEALQEEIRAKDEQIANLEARLAAIEALLGINNDN